MFNLLHIKFNIIINYEKYKSKNINFLYIPSKTLLNLESTINAV